MTRSRTLHSSLPALLVLVLLGLSACSDSDDSRFRIQRETGEKQGPETGAAAEEASTEAEPAPPPEPFIIYYTIDPVPEKLLKGWKAETQVDWPVEQRALSDDLAELPVDGDLYVVTPQWIPLLQATLELESLESSPLIERINPTFTGFSFDPGNRISLPWRWTPYGYVVQAAESGFEPGEWIEKDDYVWPRDPILRAAVWRRHQGVSANAFQRAAPAPENPDSAHTWESCRTHWQEGNFRVIYLPVAWWLQRPAESGEEEKSDQASPRLRLSRSGELLHFEHLIVPSDRHRVTMSRALAAYLLNERAQQWLLPHTGYFPVISLLSRELKGAELPVDASTWLDRCEFALAPPAYREPRVSTEPENPDAEDQPPNEGDEDKEKENVKENGKGENPEKPIMAPIDMDRIPLDPPLS